MTVLILTITASLAALLGGYTAIRGRRWLDLTLALTAGLVLGVVTFDLLPEIFSIVQAQTFDPAWPMIALTAGILLFHVLEKFGPLHQGSENQYGPHRHPRLGFARAAVLAGHSFLDGLSIGVSFKVSPAVGTAVSIAVIGHRFADGFDTTTFMLFHRNKLNHIRYWLAVVTLMPIAGGLASLVVLLSQTALAIYLGFFAGFLIYIAASNLLPQAHSQNSSRKALLLTLLGTSLMFIITRLV